MYNIFMEKLLKIFSPAWLVARVGWSNFRNAANLKDCQISENLTTISSLEAIAKNYYKKFTYELDGPDEAFDSMRFPAQCYYDLVHSGLKDDCDGFHAAMYHIADHCGYNCYLLTYICKDINASHTVLVINNNGWHKLDYTKMTHASTLKQLMARDDIISYNLVKFNYSKSKWYVVKETN